MPDTSRSGVIAFTLGAHFTGLARPKALPSAGLLPLLQSRLCGSECYTHTDSDESLSPTLPAPPFQYLDEAWNTLETVISDGPEIMKAVEILSRATATNADKKSAKIGLTKLNTALDGPLYKFLTEEDGSFSGLECLGPNSTAKSRLEQHMRPFYGSFPEPPKMTTTTSDICKMPPPVRESACGKALKVFAIHDYTRKTGDFRRLLGGVILLGPQSPSVEKVAEVLKDRFNSFTTVRDQIFRLLNSRKTLLGPYGILGKALTTNTGGNLNELLDEINRKLKPLDQLSQRSIAIASLASCVAGAERVIVVKDEAEMEKKANCLKVNENLHAGVFFHVKPDASNLPKATAYSIRMATAPKGDKLFPANDDGNQDIFFEQWNTGNTRFSKAPYHSWGFLYLQEMIDRAIIKVQTGKEPQVGVYTQHLPNPCRAESAGKLALFSIVMLTPLWTLSVAVLVKSLVHEKQLRLREFMRVMGLRDASSWLGWGLSFFLPMSILSVVLGLVLLLVLSPGAAFLLIFLLQLYAIAAIAWAFALSTLFKSPPSGATVSLLLFYSLSLLAQGMPRIPNKSKEVMVLTAFLPQIAFAYAAESLKYFEAYGGGLSTSTMMEAPGAEGYSLPIGVAMIMLVASTLLCLLLTFYIDNVRPGEYGIPQKPWFILLPSYWRPPKPNTDLVHDKPDYGNAAVEEDASGTIPGVVLSGLSKVYGDGKVALDNLSISFPKNQITSFLGHNGAGKTTSMSIMCGMFPPSKGTVFVDGLDVRTDIARIRRSLGTCPQYNILYDSLTVEEQIRFYAGIRGVPKAEISGVVDKALEDVGLVDKRRTQAAHLSGGMKRKLSIALAFLGDSTTVILDEPTAGVDPHSR